MAKKKSNNNNDKQNNDIKIADTAIPMVIARETLDLEQTQIYKYHTKGGTGFAAEDATAAAYRANGEDVKVSGHTNKLNGPDLTVDGKDIQIKFYKTARETIGAAFDENDIFRYGKQHLEVPAEQYEDAVSLMKEKIKQGKVPGFKRPSMAKNIVRKGTVTYDQAKNIAKSGNVDSISFDMQTQAVSASYIFGLSFAINIAQGIWSGEDYQGALKSALNTGLSSGGKSFIAGCFTNQILRTKMSAISTVAIRHGVKIIATTEAGKAAISSIASASSGRALSGAAATNHVSKLACSNVIAGTVLTIIQTGPDFYRTMIDGSASWGQLLKNFISNAGAVTGGLLGGSAGATCGTGIGSAVGAAVGSVVPGAGTAAGFALGAKVGWLAGLLVGGGAGSIVGGSFAKAVMDGMIEDDAVKMLQAINEALIKLSHDYLLTKQEVERFIETIKKAIEKGFLRDLYKATQGDSKFAASLAVTWLDEIPATLLEMRPKIKLPPEDKVFSYIETMAKKLMLQEDEAKYFSIGAFVVTQDYSIAGISFGNNRLGLFYDSGFTEFSNVQQIDIGRIGIVNITNFPDHAKFIGYKQEENDGKCYPPLKIAARAFFCLGKNAVNAFEDDISIFCEWCSKAQCKTKDLANYMHQEGFLPDISEPDKKVLNEYFNKDQNLLLPERERLAFACWQYFNQPAKFPFGKSFVHSSQSDEKTFKSCAQNSGSKILFCYSGSLLGKGPNDWYVTEKGFCWPNISKFVPFDEILMVQSDLFFLKLTTTKTEHRFPISFVDSNSIEDFVLSMISGLPLPPNSLSSCFLRNLRMP